MTKLFRFMLCAVLVISLCGAPVFAQPQLNSNVATVSLSYQVAESITVAATPTSATFTGTTPTTGNISVTTSWQLASGRTHMDTSLYFTTATAALTDGAGDNIPTSQVFENMDGGTYGACTATKASDNPTPPSGVCPSGVATNLTAANLTGTNTHVFTLQLQNLSASLPAGVYSGTLNVVAGSD